MVNIYELEKIKEELRHSLIKDIPKGKKRKKVVKWVIDMIKSGKISLEPSAIPEMINQQKGDKKIALIHLYHILNEKEYGNTNKKDETKSEERSENTTLFVHSSISFSSDNAITVKSHKDKAEKSLEGQQDNRRLVIGRVALTPYSPSTPTQFYFWIKDEPKIHVEPGTLITVEDNELKVVGIVEDIKAMSEVPNTMSEFYGWGYGNPEESMATHRPVIREALAKVITRNDGRSEPLIRKHPVYLADRNEIIEAYSANINDEDKFLVGFTKDANNNFVPVYADFEYIFGYNGVHVNISGASGLAAKTSYALFLILSALAYSKKYPEKGVAIVAFNVKEKDLLDVLNFRKHFPSLDKVIKTISNHPRLKISAKLWEEAKKEGINPFELLSSENVHIYEPGKDFKFGLMDLIELGDGTPDLIRLMYEKEDLNENFEAMLLALTEFASEKKASFSDILNTVKAFMHKAKGDNITISGTPIWKKTAIKFLNRTKVALNQLQKIIDKNNPYTSIPLNFHKHLKPGNLIIIDIRPLPDRGKRLVFLSILKLLNKILEMKKEMLLTGATECEIEIFGDHYPLTEFPSRVAVFIDELNKFAPKGKEYSSIKAPIIDIAARGRSIGLSLIGAQQMASQVDQEILANCSTFVVGRSHPIEISGKAYDWLKGGLKERVTFLKQGELIMYHAIHSAPVLIYFPIPLHRIPTNTRTMNNGKEQGE